MPFLSLLFTYPWFHTPVSYLHYDTSKVFFLICWPRIASVLLLLCFLSQSNHAISELSFDVRVFIPLAKRYATFDPQKCYELNEKETKREYNERILQIEHT